jgi:hypothetical protein
VLTVHTAYTHTNALYVLLSPCCDTLAALCCIQHKQISGIAVSSAGVVSVGWDDTLRLAPTGALLYSEAVALTGQPCAIAANVHSDLAAVATR